MIRTKVKRRDLHPFNYTPAQERLTGHSPEAGLPVHTSAGTHQSTGVPATLDDLVSVSGYHLGVHAAHKGGSH